MSSIRKIKKRRFNKKAEADGDAPGDFLLYIGIIAVIAVPAILLAFILITSPVSYQAKVPDSLKEYAIISKMVSSEECFGYQDKFGEYVKMSIDMTKFNTERFDECYPVGMKKGTIPISMTLFTQNKSINLNSSNWDPDKNPRKKMRDISVTIYDNGNKLPGKVEIGMQNART